MQTPNSEFSLLKLRRRFSRCKTASQTDVRGPKEVVKTASSLASSRLEWGVGDRSSMACQWWDCRHEGKKRDVVFIGSNCCERSHHTSQGGGWAALVPGRAMPAFLPGQWGKRPPCLRA